MLRAQPMVRLLSRNITEPCSWSPRTLSWSRPNMSSTSEKTRSDGADEGSMANMIRAALAHVGNLGWLKRHHVRMPSVNSAMSVRVVEACARGGGDEVHRSGLRTRPNQIANFAIIQLRLRTRNRLQISDFFFRCVATPKIAKRNRNNCT